MNYNEKRDMFAAAALQGLLAVGNSEYESLVNASFKLGNMMAERSVKEDRDNVVKSSIPLLQRKGYEVHPVINNGVVVSWGWISPNQDSSWRGVFSTEHDAWARAYEHAVEKGLIQ